MVGQSLMHTTVMAFSVFGPHSWGALLREGSSSLNGMDHLQNHWSYHWSCRSPFVDHLLDFIYHAICLEFCWEALKIYARLSYLVCMLNGIVICSGPQE